MTYLCWVHQVLKNGVVHRGQGAATRPHLLANALFLERLALDTALGNNDHDTATELLLELPNQACLETRVGQKSLVVFRQKSVWHLGDADG